MRYVFLTLVLFGCASSDIPVVNNAIIDDAPVVEEPPEPKPTPLLHPDRITKKPFGIFITPENSPVQPEKFTGYHVGTDFEVFEGEPLPMVEALCDGDIKVASWVKGYGGLIIQSCVLEGEPVTVLYGHVSQDSFTVRTGEFVTKGSVIAQLGEGGTRETDGERAHLHLGIHKGSPLEYRGYAPSKEAIQQWVDPAELL